MEGDNEDPSNPSPGSSKSSSHHKTRSKKWRKMGWFGRHSGPQEDHSASQVHASHKSGAPKGPINQDDSPPSSLSSASPVDPRSRLTSGSSSEDESEEWSARKQTIKRSPLYPNSEIEERSCLKPSLARALFLQLEAVTSRAGGKTRFNWPKKNKTIAHSLSKADSLDSAESADQLVRTVSMPSEIAGEVQARSTCHCPACCTCSPLERLQGSCPAFVRRFLSTTSLDTGLSSLGYTLEAFTLQQQQQDKYEGIGQAAAMVASGNRSPAKLPSPTDPYYTHWIGEEGAAVGGTRTSVGSNSGTEPHKTNSLPAYFSQSLQKKCRVCGRYIRCVVPPILPAAPCAASGREGDPGKGSASYKDWDNSLPSSEGGGVSKAVEPPTPTPPCPMSLLPSFVPSEEFCHCRHHSNNSTLTEDEDISLPCSSPWRKTSSADGMSDEGSADPDARSSFRTSFDSGKLNPTEFKKKKSVICNWFSEFNDEQKNLVLKKLLEDCQQPQLHVLSLKMGHSLHSGCPPNCQDGLSWLPQDLSLQIIAYLDPVSLCRSSSVCKKWYCLATEPSLWRHFCTLPKWRLSRTGEHKQLLHQMRPDGSIRWKKVFAERFRLRKNWMSGRCNVRTFEGHTQGVSCVQFDDTRIVSGSSDKTIKVWNIRTNSPWAVQTLVGHSGTVRCLHLDGNRLISGSTDRTIKVWDLSMQQCWSSIACRVTMTGHTDTVRCLQVEEDKAISGSYDKTLKVWNINTGQCRMTLRGHGAAVLCVQFDKTKIVSGSCDKTIKVWTFEGECVMSLQGHQDAVTCLQFDSTRIFSGSLDCNLKFWDIQTGVCSNTIDWKASEGHTGVVRCLQADSWRVVSASDDRTLKVWSLETGQRLVTLRNHTDGVTCLQFNDSIIVSGSYDKTVKLWDFSCC